MSRHQILANISYRKAGWDNHAGQSVLYLAEDLDTAVAEKYDHPHRAHTDEYFAMQEFEFRNLWQILDLQTNSRSVIYSALTYAKVRLRNR